NEAEEGGPFRVKLPSEVIKPPHFGWLSLEIVGGEIGGGLEEFHLNVFLEPHFHQFGDHTIGQSRHAFFAATPGRARTRRSQNEASNPCWICQRHGEPNPSTHRVSEHM